MRQELKQLVTCPVGNRKSKCMHACTQLALSSPTQFSLGWVGLPVSVSIIKTSLYLAIYGSTLCRPPLNQTFPTLDLRLGPVDSTNSLPQQSR